MSEAPERVLFDRPDQLAFAQSLLIDGELLEAVLDCKPHIANGFKDGFVAITDRRLLVFAKDLWDRNNLAGGVTPVTGTASYPWRSITATGFEVRPGSLGRFLFLRSAHGGNVEIEFTSADRAMRAQVLFLRHVL